MIRLSTRYRSEAWLNERDRLREVIGSNLTMGAVVAAMVGSAEAWTAVEAFAESVLLAKEIAERERQMAETVSLTQSRDSEGSG